MSRQEVEAMIEELSTNVGLTEALADDLLDTGGLVQWAAAHVQDLDDDAEAEFTAISEGVEAKVQELNEAGYDLPVIVLALWFHIQRLELFLRDAPEEETEDVTPMAEYLPFEEDLPETPMRPVDEVEELIENLGTNIGLTEALMDDLLDAGHLVTWAATRSHDAMSPGGETEFTEAVEEFTEFLTDQREAGREWPLIVYAVWMHVQEVERFLRLNQPTPDRDDDGDDGSEENLRGFY